MHYLGSKNEDEFVSIAVKLSYHMLTKKMYNKTAAKHVVRIKYFQKITKNCIKIFIKFL